MNADEYLHRAWAAFASHEGHPDPANLSISDLRLVLLFNAPGLPTTAFDRAFMEFERRVRAEQTGSVEEGP